MLDDVMRSCSHSPESSILFYDEMSSVVRKGTLDTAVLRHLSDEITTKFQARSALTWLPLAQFHGPLVLQDTYLVESGDPLPSDLSLPMQLAYSLDSAEEGSIALNLLPLGMQQVCPSLSVCLSVCLSACLCILCPCVYTDYLCIVHLWCRLTEGRRGEPASGLCRPTSDCSAPVSVC